MEAAKAAGATYRQIQYWREHGHIHGQRRGRIWLWPAAEVRRIRILAEGLGNRGGGTPIEKRIRPKRAKRTRSISEPTLIGTTWVIPVLRRPAMR
jgi:hypothetical protein